MMRLLILLIVLPLPGCMDISASLQPENASVPEIRVASDCVPIILGFAYGHASVDKALREKSGRTYNFDSTPTDGQTLTKIRRIQIHDYQFLMFGARCVEVVGE